MPTNTPTPVENTATSVPTDTPVVSPTETPTATSIPEPRPATPPTPSTPSARDRAALLDLYDATNGPDWIRQGNWLTDGPLIGWEGVELDQDGRVVQLELYENRLSGELPESLGNLSKLAVLLFKDNNLSGEIPASLGNLKNLEVFWIAGNRFSGCIPDALRYVVNNDFEYTGLPFCGDGSLPINTPEASPTEVPEPAPPIDTPTPEAIPTDTPTAEPTPTATATPAPSSVIANAFSRFNQERQSLALKPIKLIQPSDSDLIKVQEIVVGCEDSIRAHEELMLKTLDGIEISISDAGSECGLKVITYHIVPDSKKMRVEKAIWDCFAQSADINTPGDVSCGGRFEAYGRHVKWHPEEIFYYSDSETMRNGLKTLIPWVMQKTKTKVSEVQSAASANLVLYLGERTAQECPGRAGCSYARQGFGREASEIFISEAGTYFNQVLKHELLHVILPMGHLPAGNTLMTIRPDDPSQTNNLTAIEEKLLKLYIDPYLREGMTMDQYKQYLIIE